MSDVIIRLVSQLLFTRKYIATLLCEVFPLYFEHSALYGSNLYSVYPYTTKPDAAVCSGIPVFSDFDRARIIYTCLSKFLAERPDS